MADLTPPLRILVAAENALARAGLAALLHDRAGLDIVGQSGLDTELDVAIDLTRPDVIVCDLGYDPQASAALLTEASALGPAVLALVADTASVTDVGPALLSGGVRGVLAHHTLPETLALAVQAVGQGLTVFGPELVQSVIPSLAAPYAREGGTHAHVGLTPRETEVLALLAEGLPNKLIARRLQVSEHTVKFHINALMTKLGAASRTEAVVRATRLGLIAL